MHKKKATQFKLKIGGKPGLNWNEILAYEPYTYFLSQICYIHTYVHSTNICWSPYMPGVLLGDRMANKKNIAWLHGAYKLMGKKDIHKVTL